MKKRIMSCIIVLFLLPLISYGSRIFTEENRMEAENMTWASYMSRKLRYVCNSRKIEAVSRIDEVTESFLHPQVSLLEVGENYELRLYDQNGQEVEYMQYTKEPRVVVVEGTSYLFEISYSTGNPATYTFYFDAKEGQISETYFNSTLMDYFDWGYFVFYYDGEQKTIVLTELFGEQEWRIERDFAPYINPVIEADFEWQKQLVLTYYSGKEAVQVTETIPLTNNKPIVTYGETPYILQPKLGEYFIGYSLGYGGDWETFGEESGDAEDFGFKDWHWMGCSDHCAVTWSQWEFSASSELESAEGRYEASNLDYLTGRNTVWAEGVEGPGIGERIKLRQWYYYGKNEWIYGSEYEPSNGWEPFIYDGYLHFTQLCVVNGYAKNEQLWEENGRVKRLLMLVEGKPYAYLELEDTIKPQYFTLPQDSLLLDSDVELTCEFVIEEVYPGARYEDTCLTGIAVDFVGLAAH